MIVKIIKIFIAITNIVLFYEKVFKCNVSIIDLKIKKIFLFFDSVLNLQYNGNLFVCFEIFIFCAVEVIKILKRKIVAHDILLFNKAENNILKTIYTIFVY